MLGPQTAGIAQIAKETGLDPADGVSDDPAGAQAALGV
jgi:hypothetical protein